MTHPHARTQGKLGFCPRRLTGVIPARGGSGEAREGQLRAQHGDAKLGEVVELPGMACGDGAMHGGGAVAR